MTKDKNYMEDLKYVPHHKMGIKLLGKRQLENLFPNYESLFRRIDEHRNNLKILSKDRLPKGSQYNLMYDNIYSILGKRGAGKTSAVFTVKKMLQSKNKCDIVLPIIMPEMIPQECNMIGWLLALLEEDVKKLDSAMQTKKDVAGSYFSECMHQSSHSLKKQYEKVKELCYSQFYEVKGNESFAATIINRERQTQNSFEFSKQMVEFWNLLIETIKQTNKLEDGTEPLVYIIFDDVDLMPEIVLDLLSTIIKYLSHPNLIVFLTADEELLYHVIETNMNERLSHYEEMKMYSELMNAIPGYQIYREQHKAPIMQRVEDKLVAMKEIPRLYGDKILPPSCRYYLKTFDACEDKALFLEQESASGLERTLENVFKDLIGDYLKVRGLEESDNFLMYGDQFVRAYFIFWGVTSRQLNNEVLILREFITCLNLLYQKMKEEQFSKEKYVKKLYENILDFAYNTMVAKGQGEMSLEEIRKLLQTLIVCRPGNWGIYLNYSYLRDQVESVQETDETRSVGLAMIKKTLPVIILMFFVENLLILESKSNPDFKWKDRQKVHGLGVLVEILDYITAEGYSLVCRNQSEDVKGFLWFYEKILDYPETLIQFSLTEPRTVRNYLNKLPVGAENDSLTLEIYAKENPKWFKSMVQILYFAHEAIYNVRESTILMKKLDKKMPFTYDTYYSDKMRGFKQAMIETLSEAPWKNRDKKIRLEAEDTLWEDIEAGISVQEFNLIMEKEHFGSYLSYVENVLKEEGLDLPLSYAEKHFSGGKQIGIGTREGTFALFTRVEDVCQKILDLYAEFQYYEISNIDEFKELLQQINWIEDWKLNVLELEDTLFDKKVYVVDMQGMGEMLQYLGNEIVRLSNSVSYSNMFENNQVMNRINELNNFHNGFRSVLKLAVINWTDLERSIRIIKYNRYYKELQEYYFISFVEEQKKYGNLRIELDEIPYKKLYEKMVKKLTTGRGYYKQLMKRYIKEGITEYIERVSE